MKRIENFVKHTFKEVPKGNREEIIKSVTESLVEKVEDLVETGLSEADAIDKAVTEFGSVEDYYEKIEKKEKRERRLKTLRHYYNDLWFSVIGSAIIIGALIFINLYYADAVIWFVVPALAVLFWPLAVLYNLWNKKENRRENKDE